MSTTRVSESACFVFAFEVLPDDVFQEVTHYLVGWDLVHLSHTSRWLHRYLNQEKLWQKCVITSQEAAATAKYSYIQTSSLSFQGQHGNPIERVSRGGSVEVDPSYLHNNIPFIHVDFSRRARPRKTPSILRLRKSFDAWFSLLPTTEGIYSSGILLGSQSIAFEQHPPEADNQVHYVHVDTAGKLYCSLLPSATPVATNLESNRWYHFALSNDGSNQLVYLDGVLVKVDPGRYNARRYIAHAQIRNGYMYGHDLGSPSTQFNGWYGFHGIIHEFRIWNHVLSAEEIALLARGEPLDNKPSFSLRQAPDDMIVGSVQRIRSSM